MAEREDVMEEHILAGRLLGFYGVLLTDATRDVLELYFSDDMSLSEIAEIRGTSRQAVHDHIRRGVQSLLDHEQRLRLLTRHDRSKSAAQNALEALNRGDSAQARRLMLELLNDLDTEETATV